MNVRIRAAHLLGIALLMSACGGGGGGTESVSPTAFDEEDLPDWVLALPEGVEPRDNDHTAEAELFLLRAEQGGDPEEWDAALEAAEAGIELDPGNPQSYFQAGRAYLGMGELRSAAEMFDRAEEIYPRYIIDTEVYRESEWIESYNAALEFLPDQPESAAPHLEDAHAIYRERPEAALQLAGIRTNQGRTDEAIELFDAVVEIVDSPRVDEIEDQELLTEWMEIREIALSNLGHLLFEAERYAEAADVYEAIVEGNPGDLTALSNLAAALVTSGQTEEAAAIYDELLERDDLTSRDFFLIGIGLFESEQYEPAAQAFAAAHEALPESREALFNYVQSLYVAEMFEELVDVAPRLIEVEPYDALAYQFYAQALVRINEEHRAVEVMEEMQALPFIVEGMQMEVSDGGAAVAGQVVNRNGQPGQEVTLRFSFYGEDGVQAGTEEVTVTLADIEEAVGFQAEVASNQEIVGYSYEVL